MALLYASKELDKLQTANFDQKIGVQIIQNALKVCMHWLKLAMLLDVDIEMVLTAGSEFCNSKRDHLS